MMSSPAVRAVVAVIVLVATLGLSGCGSGSGSDAAGGGSLALDSPLVQAARQEGKVLWYAGQIPEQVDNAVEVFRQQYGIEVETVRTSGAQLTQRFSAGVESGNVPDIISTSQADFYETAAENGWLMDLGAAGVPSLDAYPREYLRYGDTTAVWFMGPQVLAYNTDRVSSGEVPKTWTDLLAPGFAGEIIYSDPRNVMAYLDLAALWRETYGPEFLQGFGAQQPTLVESSVPGLQSLAAGEAKVLVPTLPDNVMALKEKGAPIDYVTLGPTKGIEVLFAASANAPHPNAAKLFAEFLISRQGQEATVLETQISPTGVTGVTPPEGYRQPELDTTKQQSAELLDELGVS